MITSSSNIPVALSFDDVLLVPKRSRARSRSQVDISSHLSRNIRLRLPILSSNVDFCTESAMAIQMARLGGIGFIHRVNLIEEEVEEVRKTKQTPVSLDAFPNASVDQRGRLLVAAAVGVIDDYLDRAAALVQAGADLLVIDIAHGHADHAIDAVRLLKKTYPEVDVVAGNVATMEGTRDLIDAGADAIKVGIGPGGVCTTRLVAGAGVPQISAIIQCAEEARKSGIPVIGDGGVRHPGDVTKALAAGASTVMLGSALSGTDESCAILVEKDGVKYKMTTGEPTLGMKAMLQQKKGQAIDPEEIKRYVPEGAEATFPYSGPLENVLLRFAGGLRSGMSYSGAMNIEELWDKAEFCQITSAGMAESVPHATTRAGVPQLAEDPRKAHL